MSMNSFSEDESKIKLKQTEIFNTKKKNEKLQVQIENLKKN